MFPIDKIEDIQRMLGNCVKCGMCQSVCPIYEAEGGEENISRGKQALLKGVAEGKLELDKPVIRALGLCVGCAGCQSNCKNEVEYIRLLSAGRRMVNEQKHIPVVKKLALGIFSRRDEAEGIATYGSLFNKVLNLGKKGHRGLDLKFPLPGFGKGLYVPPMAEQSFLDTHGGTHRAKKEWIRVAFFVGCTSSFILPEIAQGVLDFMLANGVTVIIPPEQVCCGTPHYISGDPKTSNILLEKNEHDFSRFDFDAVITGCPTCGGGLKEFYEIHNKSLEKVPVYDFNEFIIKHREKFEINESEDSGTYTWHDPCHLAKLQKIKKEPRSILRDRLGSKFSEMEKPDTCCGFGGVFAAANPRTALNIASKKSARIIESDASTVVTSCPGCVLFLRLGRSMAGGDYKIQHISTILTNNNSSR